MSQVTGDSHPTRTGMRQHDKIISVQPLKRTEMQVCFRSHASTYRILLSDSFYFFVAIICTGFRYWRGGYQYVISSA